MWQKLEHGMIDTDWDKEKIVDGKIGLEYLSSDQLQIILFRDGYHDIQEPDLYKDGEKKWFN